MVKPFHEIPDFKNIRLLFLDVDGVINSRKTMILAGGWPNSIDEWHLKYKDTYLKKANAFDKYSIFLVNQVCKATETFIVISSSWRNCYESFDHVLNMMEEIGIERKYIIGRTDDLVVPQVNRGAQIMRFIETFKRDEAGRKSLVEKGLLLPQYAAPGEVAIDSYVIVDDMDGEEVFYEQLKYLVKTDDYEGLTLRDTLKIGQILTSDIAFGTAALQGKDSKFRFK